MKEERKHKLRNSIKSSGKKIETEKLRRKNRTIKKVVKAKIYNLKALEHPLKLSNIINFIFEMLGKYQF
jgi:hypothetical protein